MIVTRSKLSKMTKQGTKTYLELGGGDSLNKMLQKVSPAAGQGSVQSVCGIKNK